MSTYLNFYGEGKLGPANLPGNTPAIEASGFNSVTFGLFHIGRHMESGGKVTQKLGDIVYNDTGNTVATDGAISSEYGQAWKDSIIKLKASGKITKLYFSFGGGSPVIDFTTLKNSIMVDGKIPETSSFYLNFMAMGKMFADVIDGIDVDNEDCIESNVIAEFSKLALAAGFKEVTFCPPFSGAVDIWLDAASVIDKVAPGALTRINCQYYGSANPINWPTPIADRKFTIPPVIIGGVSANSSTTGICELFSAWKLLDGFTGGFVWSLGIMGIDGMPPYSKAIADGMSGNC